MSCAKQDLPISDSAKNEPKIPEYLLVPIDKPVIKGTDKYDLLEGLIEFNMLTDKANCRLYEARILNNPELKEPLPDVCKEDKSLD